MLAITVNSSQQLEITEVSTPTPAFDECLIEVKAFGINRADLLQRAGKYPPPQGESEILGLEVSGVIVAMGEGAQQAGDFHIGQRVFGLVPGGGYAQFAIIKSSHMLAMPTSMSFTDAAAIAETYLTALQAMFYIGKCQENAQVLIHAGASGVGSAAIRLAKAKQCFVATTVGSEDKAEYCRQLGADLVINYNTHDFVEVIKAQCPKKMDVIIDVVAGDYLAKNINVAALDARIVVLAILGGRYCESLDMAKMLSKRITLSASTLRNRSNAYKAELVQMLAKEFMPLFERGELKADIDAVASWKLADELHQKMANNQNKGKLVLTVD